MDLVVDQLASHHDRLGFSCGVPALDVYIHEQAGQDVRRHLAVCYILHERESTEIIGYYTLSSASVELSDFPAAVARRFGRYRVVPATLIGRLAANSRWRGQGMGEIDTSHQLYLPMHVIREKFPEDWEGEQPI